MFGPQPEKEHSSPSLDLRANSEQATAFCRCQWLLVFRNALFIAALIALALQPAKAVVLWSDLGATLVHASGPGTDILDAAVKRDDTAADTLYFKFHVEPLSDFGTEEYLAAFQLYEGTSERLGVGNSLKAWAYSAFNTDAKGEFNTVQGDIDLRAAVQEATIVGSFRPYELPRRGIGCTIVFKVEYVAGGNDRVTVWLNPDLAPGATEAGQPESLTTRFTADASFNEVHLRHEGGGDGWVFSDMEIATSFSDFVAVPFTIRTWQREQGLPENSVYALAQTRDGYLWLGNDEGIARFDGARFVPFGLREGLHTGRVRCLLQDSSGALWLGTADGGLTQWKDGRFTRFTTAEGLPADSITALAEDKQGRIWIGTEAGLALCANQQLAPLPAADQFRGKAITTLFKDRHGAMWLGAAAAGLFRYEQSQFTRLSDPSVDALLLEPHCLLEDGAGRIWVGAGEDYVLCREGDQWRRYRLPRHVAHSYVHTLVEERDGTVWAGSLSEGLFQFKNGRLSAINTSSGLSDNFIESLLVDSEGNVWVGTASGLNRLRHKKLTALSQNEGLGSGAVQGLAEIATGVLWAGKPNDGLYRWKGRSFERVGGTNFLWQCPDVNALLVAEDGSCWVGSGNGLWRFRQPSADAPEPDAPVLEGHKILALAQGAKGTLWAGTADGQLWMLRSGHWQQQTNISAAHALTSICPTKDGSVWLGTWGSGLFRWRGEPISRLEKQNGVLSDFVRTLHVDAAGVLWVGTAGGGLSVWRDGQFVTFTTAEGLPDNTISQVLEDDTGRLWLGTSRGIARANKQDLKALPSGRASTLYPQIFGRTEGMLSEECTGGFTPAGLKTKSGQLWFPTMKGIVVAEPQPQRPEMPPPGVALEEVWVDGVLVDSSTGKPAESTPDNSSAVGTSLVHSAIAQPWSTDRAGARNGKPAALTLAPGKHRLEFHYTGLSFSAPERIRFRYRLEKLDSDWVEAEGRRAAYYPYVPQGEYVFRVTACNSEGVWNPASATLQLTVRPYMWQTWWFLSAVALGLLGSVGGAVRIMEKRKLHRRLQSLEQERTLERERARIAQDLHDDLGASLTRVSLLSELLRADKENPEQVEAHAGKISQSARQTVRALEEIVWALRPGSDSLHSLLEYIAHFATELFEGDRARCRLDLQRELPERSLPPELRHNIFLIVKEALTNALKHAAATVVRVQARATADTLELVVQDDGHGFALQKAQPKPGKGHGLGNMQRRAENSGGSLEVKSEPGKGTVVRLVVPL